MHRRSFIKLLLVTAMLLPLAGGVLADDGAVNLPYTGMNVKVASFKELRMSRVVKQNYDFSCGSAALATLLTYTYNKPTTEEQAFERMYAVGDQAHIQKVGFSLLDMQKYLNTRGIRSDGYKLSMDQLKKLRLPAITLISPNGYNHFVVIRGWSGSSILIADPALGLRRVSIPDFESMWNGVVFVLLDNVSLAKSLFNDPRDIKIVPTAFYDDSLVYAREGLTSFYLNRLGINDF
jgi:uncharacterized protein